MNLQSRSIIAIVLTGSWVNASEFFRNEVLLKTYWVNHYQSLGMTFPSEPQNGMIWVAWGFLFAIAIYIISRKFNLVQTTLISWFTAFVLMWVVTWNLNVLPSAILVYAVPLSLLEAFVGSCICRKMSPNNAMESNS
jgi:ABC-type multidrug transport system fused ATPase/permease subunit